MEKPELPHEHSTNIEAVLRRMPDQGHFQSVADSFQKLGDSSRLRILWLLCHCEECVYNIAAAVGMSAPATSHHLRILRSSGLIVSRRSGKEVYYRLAGTVEARLLHRAIDELFEITCPTGEEGI